MLCMPAVFCKYYIVTIAYCILYKTSWDNGGFGLDSHSLSWCVQLLRVAGPRGTQIWPAPAKKDGGQPPAWHRKTIHNFNYNRHNKKYPLCNFSFCIHGNNMPSCMVMSLYSKMHFMLDTFNKSLCLDKICVR